MPAAEDEEDELSTCSFTFSYFSTSSSTTSSPGILSTSEDGKGEEEQGAGLEDEGEEEEDEEETKEGEEEEEKSVPAAVTLISPQSLRGPCSSASRLSWSILGRDSSSQEKEDTSSPQKSADTRSLPGQPLQQDVTDLVHFLIRKYQLKEPVTKREMLKALFKRYKKQFPMIFKKASKCLQVISGIDMKEVDPTVHLYVLVDSLDLSRDEISDSQSMPTNGLLTMILGVILMEGNCASEKSIWDFLNVMGVYAGREHFIYGEPRKLITRDWVQENYLEYQQVPGSDPPHYNFLWGPRAYAETNKMKVLEFLAKIRGTDAISFSHWYEVALRDEDEREQATTSSVDNAMFIAQRWSEVSPAPTEE
ncbi:Melanoma-associated antigen 10 [Manis javanica]|nr:Melanoma-associated antigen 10 [Manis javanica]